MEKVVLPSTYLYISHCKRSIFLGLEFYITFISCLYCETDSIQVETLLIQDYLEELAILFLYSTCLHHEDRNMFIISEYEYLFIIIIKLKSRFISIILNLTKRSNKTKLPLYTHKRFIIINSPSCTMEDNISCAYPFNQLHPFQD